MRDASIDNADVKQAFDVLSDLCRRLRVAPASERPHVIVRDIEALTRGNGEKQWVLVMVFAMPPEAMPHIAGSTATQERTTLRSGPGRVSVKDLLASLEQERPTTWNIRSECRSAAALRASQIRRFIEVHYAERLTLQRLANVVGRARTHVAASFKQETGMTLRQYVLNVRMRRAAELLSQGDKVEAVMLLVGYRSKKNFYRQFKSHAGVTPAIYRYAAPPRAHVALPHQAARRALNAALRGEDANLRPLAK